jgi:hypothetical protein
MIFIGSKSNKIGSRAIRWGRGDNVSHFSVMFFDNLMIESRGKHGVHPIWLERFLENGNEIVTAVKWDVPRELELVLYRKIRDELATTKYDYNGIFWLGAWGLLRKAGLIKKAPKNNQWGDGEKQFCVEVVQPILAKLQQQTGFTVEKELEAYWPQELLNLLAENSKLTKIKATEIKSWRK